MTNQMKAKQVKTAAGADGKNGKLKQSKKKTKKTTAAQANSDPAGDLSANRPSLGRLSAIAAEIREGNYPNCTDLTEKFGVHRITILRDIETLCRDFGQPIDYDPKKRGYYYTDPSVPFPTVQMTVGELISLIAGYGALESYGDTTFAPQMRQAIGKIIQQQDYEIRMQYEHLQELLSFRPGQSAGPIDCPLLLPITKAAAARLEIEFDYRNTKKSVIKPRRVRPLHPVFRGMWYILAEDPDSDCEVKSFALTRMTNFRVTTCTFLRPAGFNLEEHLEHSIGIYSGKDPQRVRLRMDELSARLAGEIKWHKTQQLVTNDDGTQELHLNVAITPELEQRILGWGSRIEVLEPLSLRQSVLAHAKAIVERG
jgi:predicted DNA-binding transcriptional regulator YafY